MSTETDIRPNRASMGTLDWIGCVLAVLLGVVYLYLGFGDFPETLGIAFVLAGVGYFGAVVLALIDYRRRLVYRMGIGYNALLFVLYFVINGIDVSELIGLAGIVKLAQAVFVVLLGALIGRNAR